MQFLSPLYLLGLLAAAIPVAVHLWGRSRARPLPFAALDFIVRSDRRMERRLRLRQLVLLCVRAVAAAAVAVVVARPFVETRTDLPATIGRPQSVVLVLDNSASMGYRLDGTRLIDRARKRAHEVLDLISRQSEVALVLAAEGDECGGPGTAQPPRCGAPVAELTLDQVRLHRAIDSVALSARATDLPAALRHAAQILSHATQRETRVILFTDLTAVSLGEVELPWSAGPALTLIDLSRGAPLPNRGIGALRIEPASGLGPWGMQITAVVQSYADEPVPHVPIAMRVGGSEVARGFIDLPATGRVLKTFHHTFRSGGLYDVSLALEPDNLPVDDVRFTRVEVRREVRVLLVDGDPRTVRHEDELFYLETALRPGDRSESQLAVTVITPEELPQRRLVDFDVIFLCNVKALSAERVAALQAFVRRGGGLFISLGDNVTVEGYQETMSPLLPQALRDLRVAAAGPTARPEGGPAGAVGLALGKLNPRHPIFSVFTRDREGVRGGRVERFFLLSPDARARPFGGSEAPARSSGSASRSGTAVGADEAGRQTLLRLENGAPLLVEAPLGSGRVLLLTSTIDRDWNDLAIHPGYLPLMQQATRYLARSPLRQPEPGVLVGQPQQIPLERGDVRLEVRIPGGTTRLFEGAELTGRTSMVFHDTEEPGAYQVATADRAAGPLKERPPAAFVVNVDPRESDLRHAAERPQAREGQPQVQAQLRRVNLWHGVAAVLLLLLLLETVLVRRG